jgi:hypothetical protein
MTPDEQRQRDVMHALYHAWKTLDAYTGDKAGRDDIMHRIERLGDRLRELGVDRGDFAEYSAEQDQQAIERDRLRREAAYERTGVVPHE